jgi:hypothetical protein
MSHHRNGVVLLITLTCFFFGYLKYTNIEHIKAMPTLPQALMDELQDHNYSHAKGRAL